MRRKLLTALAAALTIYGGIFYAATRPWEEPDW
jgi:hypothetical protein